MPFRYQGKHLPPQYRFAHEYAFSLHDDIAAAVRHMERDGLLWITLPPPPAPGAYDSLSGLKGEAVWTWLEDNGHSELIPDLLFRTCAHALLADSCHFLYEAMRCSEKAKLTVAFALLRKPFRENLLYLEHLLGEPESFLNSLWKGQPGELSVETLSAKRRLQGIIASAVQRTSRAILHDPEFLYQLRYDPFKPYAYDPLWTKAIHLVSVRARGENTIVRT